jgi:hypothetical protein
VPDATSEVIGESKVVSIEVLDDFLHGLFGVHFLEPLVSFEERVKARPVVKGLVKSKAEALNYM